MTVPMQLRIWWADSRGKVIAILLMLWVATLMYQLKLEYVWTPFLAVIFMTGVDLGVTYLKSRVWVFSLSSVLTGLLIGFIFDPFAGIVPLFFAVLIASLSKQLLGFGSHRHVFNPAALGIFVGSLMFDRPVGWWAAAWGIVPVIIITIGMFFVLKKLRRLWLTGLFLIFYIIHGLLFVSPESALLLAIDGTVFLFAWVMLPEPITSLSGDRWRYVWGPMVGSILIATSLLKISFVDPLLLSLLVANLMAFIFVRRPWRTS